MNPAKLSLFIALPALASLLACTPDPSRDAEIEETISAMVEAEEVVAMYHHDQMVVNISGQAPFELARNSREELAKRLARAALEVHPDADMVMIGFNRAEPELQQIAYTWENHEGSLSLIASQ